jgi:nucleoid-associated protein YgaU
VSHAYSFNPLDFDDVPRGSAEADGSAPQRIASTLRAAGIDAPSSLYNEALALARDGHLGQAVSRLQMLLCLDPDDADALLLLARVHAAQGRASDALARMDAAVAAGAVAPGGFRDLLEEEIRAERNREEEHRARVSAREQGEIRGLRQETRQLRSDNVRLEGEVQDVLTRERNWQISTVAIAIFSTGVVLALMILPPAAAPVDPVAAAPEAAVVAEAPISPDAFASDVPAAKVENAPTAVVEVPPAAPAAVVPVVAAPVVAAPVVAAPVVKAPVAEAPKPAVKAGRVHKVVSGDTLGRLALKYYGDASKWERIQAANQEVLKKGIALDVGMKLQIP